jgi:hypothetical protein
VTDERMKAITQGAFVFWDPQATDYVRLRTALEAQGLEAHCPPPHSVGLSLKKALADYCRANGKALKEWHDLKGCDPTVQRHESADRDGYEVVFVRRDKDRNTYSFLFAAKADGETVTLDGRTSGVNRAEIQRFYEHYRATVSGAGVGKMLVNLVTDLHGTCVRAIGGIYYLPEDTVSTWDRAVEAVESAGKTVVTRARIVLDDSSIRTVASAITAELSAAAEVLRDEVISGELKAEALENRAAQARRLREKAQKYEGILGVSLATVKQALEDAELASAASALALAAA